ncbi:alpha-mannosidase isoform X2 [Gastrolobium bilobum]|uniref:alpha-mannosidase isoform X2 n=1 Tax=Gastrolobium bilobum TaxID=150636 RepID=UPI002AB13A08|nr:alpha-mannosidase isoform X2 [Gastrolobium bilobum]
MGNIRTLAAEFLSAFLLLCFYGTLVCAAKYINYNTGAGVVQGKLNVHLVAHSHDDVGWLKTIDQYYVGSNNTIQVACVQNVLDSVVVSLQKDPNRKFVFAEMAFFHRWWVEQSPQTQEQVKKLVDAGQLEFVNGGWCMHDEATCHYIDMIDQTSLGHRFLKEQFNKTPRAGWQIDPFGHSAVQAYLLGAELGFDSVHFARIDYQDRAKRKDDKSLEVIWRGSKTFGSSAQIFANAFPVHYSAPNGFNFEVDRTDIDPLQDDPLIFDYNVEQRVKDFIDAATTQANVTRTNHIMWTMGDDFQYQYAESWFKQMDKLIHYVNKDGRVNALYSTPSIYTIAKNAANQSWPLKTDDYFPYADGANAYWTGFYTSRPALKRYVRMLSGYYLATRQLEFLAGKKSTGYHTFDLGDALGIAQHHDAVTGTAKQHTTNDYAKRLALGASKAEAVVSSSLACLTSKQSGYQCSAPASAFAQCQLLNISYCPPTEGNIPEDKSLVVVVYNPLGWNRTDIVRIPVNDANVVVKDSWGNNLEAQYVDVDDVTTNLRELYVKAYLGLSPKQAPKYWLLFQVSVPPLGWSTYFISKAAGKGKVPIPPPTHTHTQRDTIDIGPGDLKMRFSSTSGQLKRMYNSRTGVDIPIQQSFLWYGSSDDTQASGAYIFRPNGSPPKIVSRSVPFKVIHGPLVHEVHQNFSSWIYQVTRLYKDKDHAEIEFTIGPIPTDDGVGKEVITQMTANMATNKEFYTDSNGRDFLKRVRDHREDWPLQVTQPVAGNYYPLNLGIYTKDKKSEFSVLVDRATGGASIKDGEVELMLHRRILNDDGRGVGEALDEQVCVNDTCEGLTVRGNYYIGIHKLGAGSRWRRTTGQEIYSPLLLAFTHENLENWKSSHLTKGTVMDPNYSLPPNVALITLEELNGGVVLLRLAHLYEPSEDAKYSTLTKVELKRLFATKTIKDLKEVSLSANQEKSEMKKMTWKVEGDKGKEPQAVRGDPVNNSDFVVELGPMEIRTFLLKF